MNTAQEVWQQCTALIRQQVSEQTFDTWFKPIVPVQLRETVLTIQVPSPYFYELLEARFINELRHGLITVLGPEAGLEYQIIVDKGDDRNESLSMNVASANAEPAARPHTNGRPVAATAGKKPGNEAMPARVAEPALDYESGLAPQYTFSNYVEGGCNRLARNAGLSVAEHPGSNAFNPLVLYGGVGYGKTHLVQAIGNRVREVHPSKKVYYLSSERFITDFMQSIKPGGQGGQLFQHYLKADVLIIDDIQFLAGKEATQLLLFNIFNNLHQNRKQIIFTSDCKPSELQGMHERLLSRFRMGLVADMQQPDFETRVAIIQTKIQDDGIEIPYEVVEYLAQKVDTNVRELEGVLISLIAESSLNGKPYNLTTARQIVEKIVANAGSELSIEAIQGLVSEYFDVSVEELKATTRKQEIAKARQIAMYIAKEVTNHSLKGIGAYFGNRDHTTVLHAVRTVNKLIDEDERVKTAVDELQRKLKARSH